MGDSGEVSIRGVRGWYSSGAAGHEAMWALASTGGHGPPLASVRVLWALWLGAVFICVAPSAEAFPIRVSTATELTLNPQVSADRHTLVLSVRLRDDRRAGVEGRALAVSIVSPTGLEIRREERTDSQGESVIEAQLGEQVREVAVEVRFAGDEHFAPAATRADIELDAPFVTVELSAPAAPLSLSEPPPTFNVTVFTGRAAWLDPGGLAVDLVALEGGRARVLVAGLSDRTGLARLTPPPGAFPRAGIYQIRPRVEVRPGRLVEGAGRTVLVRADTTLTAALVSEPDDPRARLRGRLRTANDEPVGGAPIRLMRGDETVAAVRTDPAGEFAFEVDLEQTQLSGSTLRARFDPADPWFIPSESAPIRVGEAPSEPIHWAWMAAPWALLALASAAFAARGRARPAPPEILPVDVKRDAVVRTGATPDGAIEAVVEAFDRSTGEPLPAARYRSVGEDEASARPASAPTLLSRGQALSVVVSAEGYESRRFDVARLGPGRHCVRVGMLGWREAVFDRARPALAAAAEGAVIPTPREAVGATLVAGREAPWVDVLERGAYGPDAPDAQTVRAVERALGGGEATANDASDAVDAVN